MTTFPAALLDANARGVGPGTLQTIAAWAEPTLAVLGILTLVGAVWVWRERWRIANLQVGRRAYRVRRVLRLWLAPHPSFDPLPDPLPSGGDDWVSVAGRLALWRMMVTASEDEVQGILEEMVDVAGEAGPLVRRATREAYLRFMWGSDLVHSTSEDLREQRAHLVAARRHFEAVYRALGRAGPRGLLSPTAAAPDDL